GRTLRARQVAAHEISAPVSLERAIADAMIEYAREGRDASAHARTGEPLAPQFVDELPHLRGCERSGFRLLPKVRQNVLGQKKAPQLQRPRRESSRRPGLAC